MKVIFFAIALILLLPYSHAADSGYKTVSTQVFANSTLYQDLVEIGFYYTLQKAVYGGGNNTLPKEDWSYYNEIVTVAVKNQSGVLYLKGKVNLTEYVITFAVHYRRSTGQIGVTNMNWLTVPSQPNIFTQCAGGCPSIMEIPSASDIAFSYAFNQTISQAIQDHNLPNSTYKLGQIFSAFYGGNGYDYEYVYTVVGGPNKYTYRLKSHVIAPLDYEQELIDTISLYTYEVESK